MLPEIPLTTEAERLKERILSLSVTEEPFTDDLPAGLSPEDIEYYHAIAFDWRSNPVPILRSAVRKYPDFPPLYTFLLQAYQRKELWTKETELVAEMEKKFPDYLFTRLALAKRAMSEDEGVDAMLAALGGHLHLDELYPDRKVFHYAEVWQFYLMVGLIYCERGETPIVQGIMEALEELGADESLLEALDAAVRRANIMRYEEFREAEADLVQVEPMPLPDAPAPAGPLVLNHEEARIIVEVGFGMPQDLLAALLALPRDTFTEDLVRILDHCRENGAYLLDEMVAADVPNAPGLVLHLMAEIKAQGVVGPVLRFFSLHPSVLAYWLDEMVGVIAPLATILGEDIEATFAWLRSPGIGAMGKLYVSEGLGELGRRDLACRQRIVEGMAELLSFMLRREPSENILDATVVSDLVGVLSDLRAKEYLPLVELAYERNQIAKSHVGDLDEVRGKMLANEPPSAAGPVLPLLEINREHMEDWDGWEVGEAEAEALSAPDFAMDASFPMQERVDANIGRNDPCPCGSGKKYKKCCMR